MANPNGNPQNLIPRQKGDAALNPGGKPVNSRNRITKTFLKHLADDFEKNGKAAIVATRKKHPDRYVTIVASLLPKEFVIDRPMDGLSDDELAVAIATLRGLIAGAPSGADQEGVGEPTGPLQPLH